MDSLVADASFVFPSVPRTSRPENIRYPRRSFLLLEPSFASALRLLIERVPRNEKRLGGESMVVVDVREEEGRVRFDHINSRSNAHFMPERNALQMQGKIQRESGYRERI